MAPWATLVQNVVFSYVLPYVVKFGEPRWDKWLAWGENIYHFKHSSKFWLRGYSRLSCKGPLKLLNKRLRPKHEYCNNSVIFRPILMKLGMQPSYGLPFPLAKFRVQPGSPFGLPAPYPPPGAFTRPLPDSWGLPDSYRSRNQPKITVFALKSPKKAWISYHNESNQKLSLYCVNFNLLLWSFLWRFIVKIVLK